MKNIQLYIDLAIKKGLGEVPSLVQKNSQFIKKYTEITGEEKEEFKECLNLIKSSGVFLEDLDENMRENREICEAAVKENITALKYCGKSLLDDEDFVIQAYNYHPNHRAGSFADSDFGYCSERVRGSKRVCESLIKIDPDLFRYFSDEIKDDEYFALLAVSNEYTRNYSYCSKRIKAIPEIYMTAIKNKGFILDEAPKEVRDNMNACKLSVFYNPNSFEFCCEKARDDDEIVEMALKYGENIEHCSERIQQEERFIKMAIQNGGFKKCPDDVKRNKEYCLFSLGVGKKDFWNHAFMHPMIKYDRDIFIKTWKISDNGYRKFLKNSAPYSICDDLKSHIVRFIYSFIH